MKEYTYVIRDMISIQTHYIHTAVLNSISCQVHSAHSSMSLNLHPVHRPMKIYKTIGRNKAIS